MSDSSDTFPLCSKSAQLNFCREYWWACGKHDTDPIKIIGEVAQAWQSLKPEERVQFEQTTNKKRPLQEMVAEWTKELVQAKRRQFIEKVHAAENKRKTVKPRHRKRVVVEAKQKEAPLAPRQKKLKSIKKRKSKLS